ncbi:MAG: Fic family protein [Coxiellaceae bacterium]|nr:Fic family protein [Coxiellaceae bacterium]
MRDKSDSYSRHQFATNHIASILQSGEAWRYFVDGPHQAVGRLKYHETGYLPALMHSLVTLPHLVDKRLTVDDLNVLHEHVIGSVGGTLYQDGAKAREDVPGSCRKKFSEIGFGLSTQNCSQAGLFELLKNMRDNTEKSNIVHVLSSPTASAKSYIMPAALSSNSDSELQRMAEELYAELQDSAVYLKLEAPLPRSDEDVPRLLQNLLDTYYTAIDVATSVGDKITAIAILCREAAQLHPYVDGNGRMFCMQLPYLLCMQNGFPMPMMDQVNKFGCYSVEEIVVAMQNGMTATRSVLHQKQTTTAYPQTAADNAEYAAVTNTCLLQLAEKQPSAWMQLQAAVIKDDPALCPDMKKIYLSSSTHAKAKVFHLVRNSYAFNCSQQLFEEASPDLQLLRHAVDGMPFCMASLVAEIEKECEDPKAVFSQAQYEAACHGNVGFVTALRTACPALDINACAYNGETAFIGAVRFDQRHVITALQSHGANRHVLHDGLTAFIHAVHNQNEPLIMQMLAAYKSDGVTCPLGEISLSPEADKYMDTLCHHMADECQIDLLPLMVGNFIKDQPSALRLLDKVADIAERDAVSAVRMLSALPAQLYKIIPTSHVVAKVTAETKLKLFDASFANVSPRSQATLGAYTSNALIEGKQVDCLKVLISSFKNIGNAAVKEYVKNEIRRILATSDMLRSDKFAINELLDGLDDEPAYCSPPLRP